MCAQTGYLGSEGVDALRDLAAWAAQFDMWRCNAYFANGEAARARLLLSFENRVAVATAGALAARIAAAEDVALRGSGPPPPPPGEFGLWGDDAGDAQAEILARYR